MMDQFSDYVALDLETTGLEPLTDDIIEIAMIKVKDGKIIDQFESFCFTSLEISEHVSYLTGIFSKDIETAPDFITLKSQLERFIGESALVGHNIQFDWNFLLQKGLKIQNNELWDTYVMSNILYPHLPSHSLETIAKYFGIFHEDSHRAMADVMAAHELWKKLLKSFPQISNEQRDKIRILEKKSKWPLTKFFLQEKPAQKFTFAASKKNEFHERADLNIPPLKDKKHMVIHARGYESVSLVDELPIFGKTLYIGAFNHTLEKLQEILPNAYRLHLPSFYLSSQKIKTLLSKNFLEIPESTLLLKIFLWPNATTKDDLNLSHPERPFWKEFRIDETNKEENNFYKKAYETSLQRDQVIISHLHVFHELSYFDHFDQVVILDPQMLEENATQHFGKVLFFDQWKEQSSDPDWIKGGEYQFSQLEKMGRNFIPASVYPEHVLLSPLIRESNEFIYIKSHLKDFFENEKYQAQVNYLKHYQAFFNDRDPSWIKWFTIDPKKGISLHLAPLSVKTLLEKHLFQKKPCIFISDTSSTFNIFPEVEILSLPSHVSFQVYLPPLELIKGTKKQGDHLPLISYCADILTTLKGNIGVIFSSKSVLKRYFFDLAKVLPEDRMLLAEDISGGMGKIQDLYQNNEKKTKIFFLTYRNLKIFPSDMLNFDTIVLQSIPFDPPGHPLYHMRSLEYQDPFSEFVIPKTKQNLLEIVRHFRKREGNKTLIIVDRRIQEQNYGKELMKVLT